MKEPDRHAPNGTIWVCQACGKTAQDRYGIEGEHSHGWDESCMLNAVLCRQPRGLDWRSVASASAFPAA